MFKIGKYAVVEPNIKELVKQYIERGGYTRGEIQHDINQNVSYDELMNLTKQLYNMFYKRLKNLNPEIYKEFPKLEEVVGEILADDSLSPSKITNEDLVKMGDEFVFNDTEGLMTYVYHHTDNEYLLNGGSTWFEIAINTYKIDERLYINLKATNTIKFVKNFINKAIHYKEVPVPVLKFSTKYRCDQLVVYCRAEDTEKYIDYLEEIKKENPELCVGTENVDINLGNINGWIGYGEEVTKRNSSYSSIRDDMVEEFIDRLKNKNLMPNATSKNIDINPKIIKIFNDCLDEYGINREHFVFNADSKREEILKKEQKAF